MILGESGDIKGTKEREDGKPNPLWLSYKGLGWVSILDVCVYSLCLILFTKPYPVLMLGIQLKIIELDMLLYKKNSVCYHPLFIFSVIHLGRKLLFNSLQLIVIQTTFRVIIIKRLACMAAGVLCLAVSMIDDLDGT